MKLIYTSDQMPGYRREKAGTGFSFKLPDGTLLSNKAERQRILSLAIPPAYRDVWVCTLSNGHLQATGFDFRGRKQYRYHPEWHAGAGERKFEMLGNFAAALPTIRKIVRRQLASPDLSRDRAIAGIVALLDLTGYRIGNSRYEKENKSFGLSSLLSRHIRDKGGILQIRFRGKSGQEHETEVDEPRLVRLVNELQELPGQHLFRYEDEDGGWHDITTTEVNDWLKLAGNGEYTAKQFRTWKATTLCADHLSRNLPEASATGRAKVIRDAIKNTALQLNHTPATCRKYYIHPMLLKSYESGELFRIMHAAPPRLRIGDGTARLSAKERRVYKIITLPKPSARKRQPAQTIRPR